MSFRVQCMAASHVSCGGASVLLGVAPLAGGFRDPPPWLPARGGCGELVRCVSDATLN